MRNGFFERASAVIALAGVAVFLSVIAGCAGTPAADPAIQTPAASAELSAVGKPKPVSRVAASAPESATSASAGTMTSIATPAGEQDFHQATLDMLVLTQPLLGPLKSGLTSSASGRELERGGASWYGPGFQGKRTASGERYDMHALTAAHKTLPFGTMVRVKSLVNGREVMVRITDRGPFIHNRVIDLSRSAAEALGMLGLGFKQVVLMVPESTPDISNLTLTKGQLANRKGFGVR